MNLKEYEEMLSDVENRLDRLRALYEQYFQGIERLEPTVPKKEVERRMQMLRKSQPRNTALRFRTQQIIQKYTTYLTYWTRVARQIEEGTFRRDVMKARQRRDEMREQRRADRESVRPGAWDIDIEVDVEKEVEAAVAAAAPAKGPRRHSAPPPVTPIALPGSPSSRAPTPDGRSMRPALSPFALPTRTSEPSPPSAPSAPRTATFGKPRDPLAPQPSPVSPRPAQRAAQPAKPGAVDIDRVYSQYIEARRRNNERTDNVRYETIEKSISQMLPKLREKHGGKEIDFEVVVKDGKVGIKPVAK
jgi:hypothetical protein